MPHEVILNNIQYILTYTQINIHDELITNILTFDDMQSAESRFYNELSYGTNSDQLVSIVCMLTDTRGNMLKREIQSGKGIAIPNSQDYGLLITQSDKQGVNTTRMALFANLQDALAAMYNEIAYAKALDTISWITVKIINRRTNEIIKEDRQECPGAEVQQIEIIEDQEIPEENQNGVETAEETETYGG